jgi:hypothetical protein
MRHNIWMAVILGLALTAQAQAAGPSMTPYDCLGATSTVPVTVTSGTSTNGADITPMGRVQNLSGWVTFTGAGTLAITVQTRQAGKSTWYTPTIGATAMPAKSAGSYHFAIFVPICESMRLVYTAASADVGVTDATVLGQ